MLDMLIKYILIMRKSVKHMNCFMTDFLIKWRQVQLIVTGSCQNGCNRVICLIYDYYILCIESREKFNSANDVNREIQGRKFKSQTRRATGIRTCQTLELP